MARHAMVDIETLATDREALVLSVGACKFDPYSDEDPQDGRHWRIDIDEQLEMGRNVSDSTMEWWSKQSESVKSETFTAEGRIPVRQFLKEFNQWLNPSPKIWAQGPLFDIIILEDLYNSCEYKYNWAYWQIMDSRTIFNVLPKDPRKEIRVEAHNALADAIVQALCVQKAMTYISEGTKV